MDKEQLRKITQAFTKLKTIQQELVSVTEEGYLGKKVYKVTLNDGSTRMVEQITKNKDNGDAVVIIPITCDGNFVLVIESRPNTKESVALSFPAGMVDKGEKGIETAKRELLEETGYVADSIQELEWHYQDQGCSKAIIKTFVALGCKKVVKAQLAGDERLEAIEMQHADIIDLLKENKINSANSKIAFMEYELRKRRVLK